MPKIKSSFDKFSTKKSRTIVQEYFQGRKPTGIVEVSESDQQMAQTRFQECKDCIEEENLTEAIDKVLEAIDLGMETSFEAFQLAGELYWKQEMYENAIVFVTQAISLNPMHGMSYYVRGDCFVKQGKHAEGADEFEKFLKIEDPNFDVLVNVARCKAAIDQYEEAIGYFTRALEFEENADLYFLRGDAFLSLGDNVNATKDFQKVLKIDPNFLVPYIEAAREHESAESWDDALDNYLLLLKIEPNNFEFLLHTAQIYTAVFHLHSEEHERTKKDIKDDFDESTVDQEDPNESTMDQEDESAVDQEDPNESTVDEHQDIGYSAKESMQESLKRAINMYSRCMDVFTKARVKPDSETEDNLFLERGLLYLNGNPDKALIDFTASIQINSKNIEARKARAGLFREQGSHLEAVKDLEQIFDIVKDDYRIPEEEEMFIYLGTHYFKLKDFNKSRLYFIEASKCNQFVGLQNNAESTMIAIVMAKSFTSSMPEDVKEKASLQQLCLNAFAKRYCAYVGPFDRLGEQFRDTFGDFYNAWEEAGATKGKKKK